LGGLRAARALGETEATRGAYQDSDQEEPRDVPSVAVGDRRHISRVAVERC